MIIFKKIYKLILIILLIIIYLTIFEVFGIVTIIFEKIFFLDNKYSLFVKNCYNGILSDNMTYHAVKFPKISVIIPVYNGGKFLNYSLRSIQNQKMKDIEIILVDDNSSDDSLNIIQNFFKNDKRIRIIENRHNRKILYSKSIGAINAKGQYIIELDQDDIFIREDAFNIIYKEALKHDSDLVKFNNIHNDNILKFNIYIKKLYIIYGLSLLIIKLFIKKILLLLFFY